MPPQAPEPSPPPKTHWLLDHRENLLTLALAILIAFGIRTFVAEARWIPSDSMLPTLEEGDRLVVEKVTYRFVPPRRGDIVVFNPPESLQFDGAYIKRVIGLPGDRIRIQDGVVYINQKPLSEPYIKEAPAYDCPSQACFAREGEDFLVPPDSYFVMGDNRNNSQDSHVWGFLPRQNIIGNTLFRFWPLNRLHLFVGVEYQRDSAVAAPAP